MCDSKINPWVPVQSAAGEVAACVRFLGTERAERAELGVSGGGVGRSLWELGPCSLTN